MYEKICVGNKRSDAQHVFFEGMLLEEGLGGSRCRAITMSINCDQADNDCSQAKVSRGLGSLHGDIQILIVNPCVPLLSMRVS